jgi:hypothetical protein
MLLSMITGREKRRSAARLVAPRRRSDVEPPLLRRDLKCKRPRLWSERELQLNPDDVLALDTRPVLARGRASRLVPA